jgi:alpha-ribazole phosphatase
VEIYLIRHTTPNVDPGICYGQADLGLADSFDKEFKMLKCHLPNTFDIVYSSPLRRCKLLAEELSPNIIYDPRLQELNFGRWEMKPWNVIPEEELQKWMKDFVSVAVPEGENFQMLYNRVSTFYKELNNTNARTAAIIAHAGVIRAIVAIVLEIPLKNAFKLPVAYGSVTKLLLDPITCYCSVEFLNRL